MFSAIIQFVSNLDSASTLSFNGIIDIRENNWNKHNFGLIIKHLKFCEIFIIALDSKHINQQYFL